MRLIVVLASAFTIAVLTIPDTHAHWKPGTHNRAHAVTWGFCGGSYKPCGLGSQALRVARCEAGPRLSPWARNGRYLGIFQVSDHWRATVPGFAWNPWAQSRHAYRVYRLTGGWSHWECAYIVGIL